MTSNSPLDLQNQLTAARNEIRNLRKQICALSREHQTDLKTIRNLLTDFKCTGCKEQHQQALETAGLRPMTNAIEKKAQQQNAITFNPIGLIRTDFREKRAVPRQTTISSRLLGCIELNKNTFTNPEHSLDGLRDFSHLWIIYHFHKNESHTKAKVAPPRLGGERVGIFSTRSPHRPCPIGLSLVEIDRIDGRFVYFFGTDMVDGTPVLDIKPYIPRYDNPVHSILAGNQSTTTEVEEHIHDAREDPDGEETIGKNGQSLMQSHQTSVAIHSTESVGFDRVKVPNWILADTTLVVVFNDRATKQTEDLQINRTNIVEVLKNDPRSVYLRTRYGSQIFTFQLGVVTVTCKFDDGNGVVTVVQVRKSESLSSNESANMTM